MVACGESSIEGGRRENIRRAHAAHIWRAHLTRCALSCSRAPRLAQTLSLHRACLRTRTHHAHALPRRFALRTPPLRIVKDEINMENEYP